MMGSARPISWQGTLRPQRVAQQRPTGRSWYCTTPRNSADLRDDIEAQGPTAITRACVYRDGTRRYTTACGILMHSSLVVTPEGLPLGLAAIKCWSGKKFKGTNALKKKINPTRLPIEEVKAFADFRTGSHPRRGFPIPHAASLSAIARATSPSCFARP